MSDMKSFTLEKSTPLTLIVFDDDLNQICSQKYEINFTLMTEADEDDYETIRAAQIKQSISFAKCLVFLESILEHSVVITPTNNAYNLLISSDYTNNVMVLPDPNESTLLAALHAKLNSIIDEASYVETVSLKDSSGMNYRYSKTEDEDYAELPEQSDWIGELPYWEKSWWYRDDASTVDKCADNQEELDDWLKQAEEINLEEINRSVFTDIEQTVMENVDNDENKEGMLIEVDFSNSKKAEKWTPKLV